jgi:hypothetical protein
MLFNRLIAETINIAPIIIIATDNTVIAMATTDSSLSEVEIAAAAHTREFVIQIIVAIVAAIAIAYVSFRSWSAGNKVQDALHANAQARIQEAKRDATVGLAKADTEITRLKTETQALQLEVATAKKETEHERLERVKLEAQIAPRRLTTEQQKAIAGSLKNFKGRKVRLLTHVYDLEGAVLAWSSPKFPVKG